MTARQRTTTPAAAAAADPSLHEEEKQQKMTSSSIITSASTCSSTSSSSKGSLSTMLILQKSLNSAFRGGTAGFIAMVLQVVLLMWIRTVVNYQYKNPDSGANLLHVIHILYKEGGIGRFYRGFWFALMMGPLSRFGDTAANEGIREYFSNNNSTKNISVGITTMCASFVAAMWRFLLTPIDNLKTNLQVSGPDGLQFVLNKMNKHGITSLWDGGIGNWFANFVGHYPWFVSNNILEQMIPQPMQRRYKIIRRAFIGLICGIVSDICSNGIRVLKTYKQTSDLTYVEALQVVIKESGVVGFLVRGLGTKILSNAIASIFFSVIWKYIMDALQQPQQQQQQKAEKKNQQ